MQILLDLSVDGILRNIWASLCQLIYKLVAFLYELFMNVAKVKLLTQDDIKPIYQRITLILAIVMVFYVSFEVVKYIISPDTITDKEKGASGVVKRMIIVVVLIAMVPTMFEKAYDVQNLIFENQLFSKILLGKQNTSMSSYGRTFAADLFGMFYYIDDDIWTKDKLDGECDGADCDMIVTLNLGMLSSTGEMPFIHIGLADEGKTTIPGDVKDRELYYITFDGLLAVGVGIFVCWMLIMYTIDAGTRVAQLAFLQIIAPIPIIGYLSPKKDGIFQKWTKQCLSTYLDLFIRVSVIYFILLLCGIVSNAYHDGTLFANISNSSRTMEVFIYIALIMGLLAFAKRAPEMVKELFPKMSAASGSLGLSAKGRTEGLTGLVKGTGKVVKGGAKAIGTSRRLAGAGAGFAAGLVTGRGFRGARKAAQAAWDKNNKGLFGGSAISRAIKGAQAGRRVRESREDIKAAGGTPFGAEHRQGHYQNVAQAQDRKVNLLESMGKKKEAVTSAIGGVKFRKQMDSMGEAIGKSDPAAGKSWDGRKKEAEKLARQFANGDITAAQFKTGMNNLVQNFNKEQRDNAVARARSEHVEKERKKAVEQARQAHIANGGSPDSFDESSVSFDETAAASTFNESDVDLSGVVQASEFSDADLEIENGQPSSNWATVKTALDSAKTVSDEIKKQGLTYTDQDGVEKAIVEDGKSIADMLGTAADNATAAANQERDSKEYRRAHANAEGPKEGNKS